MWDKKLDLVARTSSRATATQTEKPSRIYICESHLIVGVFFIYKLGERMKYKLVRSFYRHAKDLEINRFYKEASLGFRPCSMKEAVILKSKCTEYPNSIIRIVPAE